MIPKEKEEGTKLHAEKVTSVLDADKNEEEGKEV